MLKKNVKHVIYHNKSEHFLNRPKSKSTCLCVAPTGALDSDVDAVILQQLKHSLHLSLPGVQPNNAKKLLIQVILFQLKLELAF